MFDENVRQFAEKMGLERDQFAFTKDKWADEFGLNQRKFEEDVRHNRATEANAALSNRLTQQSNAILNMSRMFEMRNKQRELAADDISREFSFYTQASPEQRVQLQTAWGERAKKGDSFAQTALNHASAFDSTIAQGGVPDTEDTILNFMASVKSDPKIFGQQLENRMKRMKAGKENAETLANLQNTINKNMDSVSDTYHRDTLAQVDANVDMFKTLARNMFGGKGEIQIDAGSALKQIERKVGHTNTWFGLGYGNTGRWLLGGDIGMNDDVTLGGNAREGVRKAMIQELAAKTFRNGRPLTSSEVQTLMKRGELLDKALREHDESTIAQLMGQK